MKPTDPYIATRKKHSHQCQCCGEAWYCCKSKCTQPQKVDYCPRCAWQATKPATPEAEPTPTPKPPVAPDSALRTPHSALKPPRAKVPATPAARALRSKLAALVAAPGTPDEGKAAAAKLARLEARYDFTQADLSKDDIFRGRFDRASYAEPVFRFDPADFDIANSVKWAIEATTGVQCLYRDGALLAEATTASAARLGSIAGTVAQSFGELWRTYHAAGAHPADRGNFILGLYEGMMHEERQGQALPSRTAPPARLARAKKRAVALAPGLHLHPYSVAVQLGAQIRFNVPLETITNQLNQTIKGEIAP